MLLLDIILVTPHELGQYTADIILESNDPDSSITKLQVVLDVITGVEEENSYLQYIHFIIITRILSIHQQQLTMIYRSRAM